MSLVTAIYDTMESRWLENTDRPPEPRLVSTVSRQDFEIYEKLVADGDFSNLEKDQARSAAKAPTLDEALALIPSFYFSPEYGIAQQQVFKDGKEGVLRMHERLNGQLSSYLDIIEITLFGQISLCHNFIESLSNLSLIQADVGATLHTIRHLKARLSSLQANEIGAGVRVAALQRRRTNTALLLQTLDQVSTLVHGHSSVELLVEAKDYVSAMDLLDTLEQAQSGLQDVRALASLRARLAHWREDVSHRVEADFVQRMSDRLVAGLPGKEGPSLAEAPIPTLLESLKRLGSLERTLNGALRDVLFSRLKKLIRQVAEEDEVGSWEHEKFANAFMQILSLLKDVADRFVLLCDLLEDRKLVGRLLDKCIEALLGRCGALLQGREAAHSQIAPTDFAELYKKTFSALEAVRDVQRQVNPPAGPEPDVGASLRTIFHNQGRKLVDDFHTLKVSQINIVLDRDRWERVDVPDEFSQVVQRLTEEELPSPPRHVLLDGGVFNVNNAVLVFCQMLCEYCDLLRAMPFVPLDIIQRVEQLLRLFNRETKEFVLRGKAAGKGRPLKQITAANLAQGSQTLAFVSALLPKLQAQIQSILRSDRAEPARGVVTVLAELQRIAEEYDEHRQRCFAQLSAVLVSRYDAHAKQWLIAIKDGKQENQETLQQLTKDITTLYRVLLKSLSADHVQAIFASSFDQMGERFRASVGPDHLAHAVVIRADLIFFHDALTLLPVISPQVAALFADLRSTADGMPAPKPESEPKPEVPVAEA
jgi:hypothetical protein